MSVKNIWSVGVFVLVVFVIIGTSILHEKKTVRRDYQVAVEPYDVIKMKGLKLRKIETTDGKDSRIDDFEIKAAPSFRIPPHRMWHVVGIHSPRDREYRSIVEREADKGIDGGGLSYRGAAERNTTEVSNELKDTKKSYKKLKLIRTRADYKKEWKNKEQQSTYSNGDKSIGVTKKTIGRRQANYYFANTDEERINRSRRCAMHAKNLKDDKSDYYSMRKAVMDKFYARQKEIAKKYAKRVTAAPTITTTPKYISYNLQEKFNKSSTTKIETNDIQNVSAKIPTNNVQKINKTLDKGRRNFVDDNAILILPTTKSNRTKVIETSTISNDTDQVTSDTSNVYYVNHLNGEVDNESNESNKSDKKENDNVLKWGTCSGNLIYQHNLIINMQNSIQSNMDLTTTVEGSVCVTCIRIIPVKNRNITLNIDVTRNKDGGINSLIFIAEGLTNMEFLYVIKIWAVRKINDRCDHVET